MAEMISFVADGEGRGGATLAWFAPDWWQGRVRRG